MELDARALVARSATRRATSRPGAPPALRTDASSRRDKASGSRTPAPDFSAATARRGGRARSRATATTTIVRHAAVARRQAAHSNRGAAASSPDRELRREPRRRAASPRARRNSPRRCARCGFAASETGTVAHRGDGHQLLALLVAVRRVPQPRRTSRRLPPLDSLGAVLLQLVTATVLLFDRG
jgi:hypothetical protein